VIRYRLVALVAAVVMTLQAAGPAMAHESVRSITLTSSQYTNGVLKSFLYAGSHSDCGNLYGDVSVRVYYDQLNTTKIRITKIVVKYYVKGPASSGLWGGTLWITDGTGSQQQWLPNLWGDHYTFYRFNSATRDIDGYSYVGTYTHYATGGSDTVNGRQLIVVKRTNLDTRTGCVGDWDYTEAVVSW
jgi:hypothetical protein